MLFAVVVAAYFVIAFMPEGPMAPTAAGWSLLQMPRIAWMSVVLFSLGALALGMGNGAVFQLIPLRFRQDIGSMTGLVGCAGGVGGFFLAQALGTAKAATGGFGGPVSCFSECWHCLAFSDLPWSRSVGARHGGRFRGRVSDDTRFSRLGRSVT